MIASFSNYSFVQFELDAAAGCTPDPAFCLPMSDPAHWQFYLYMNNFDLSPFPEVTRVLFFAYPVPVDLTSAPGGYQSYNPYYGSSTTNPMPLIFANHFSPAAGADMTVHFDYAWDNFSTVAVGECFKLMITYFPIKIDQYGTKSYPYQMQYLGFTNSFQRIDTGSCYTSVLTYSNNSDAFDFQFLWGKPNSVELPMYLRDPKMENDQKVYTKSDGTLVKLYERKEEIYTLETDLMPYAWHKALDIALSHDNVSIQNLNAAGFDPVSTTFTTNEIITNPGNTQSIAYTSVVGNPVNSPASYSETVNGNPTNVVITLSTNNALNFTKKENYEIEYQKAPLSSLGKGSCKLSNARAINLINNNCA